MPRPTRAELDEEIVETAADLFTAQGYLGTSVQEIADRVGYSKTGLLHRFSSKESLLFAVVRGPLEELTALRTTWAQLPEGPGRAVRASADLIDMALRYRSRLVLLFDAGLPLMPKELDAEGTLGDHRSEMLAFFAVADDPLEGEVRAELAITGLANTVARRGELPVGELRTPLLRAFRDACGITADESGDPA